MHNITATKNKLIYVTYSVCTYSCLRRNNAPLHESLPSGLKSARADLSLVLVGMMAASLAIPRFGGYSIAFVLCVVVLRSAVNKKWKTLKRSHQILIAFSQIMQNISSQPWKVTVVIHPTSPSTLKPSHFPFSPLKTWNHLLQSTCISPPYLLSSPTFPFSSSHFPPSNCRFFSLHGPFHWPLPQSKNSLGIIKWICTSPT